MSIISDHELKLYIEEDIIGFEIHNKSGMKIGVSVSYENAEEISAHLIKAIKERNLRQAQAYQEKIKNQ